MPPPSSPPPITKCSSFVWLSVCLSARPIRASNSTMESRKNFKFGAQIAHVNLQIFRPIDQMVRGGWNPKKRHFRTWELFSLFPQCGGVEKTGMMKLPHREKSMTIRSAVVIQYRLVMDRRTDGQTDTLP